MHLIRLSVPLAALVLSAPMTVRGEATEEPLALPGKNPPPPVGNAVNVPYRGIVIEVMKNAITIQGAGEEPKVFAVSETLAAGKVPSKPRQLPGRRQGYHVAETSMYRLTDVKVGDWVQISYAHVNGVSICDHINIFKRPGARMPALPDEAEALRNPEAVWKAQHPDRAVPPDFNRKLGYFPYHEEMNAYWALVDKGIPYPEKFGEKRRWPVAPMPREVKPKVP